MKSNKGNSSMSRWEWNVSNAYIENEDLNYPFYYDMWNDAVRENKSQRQNSAQENKNAVTYMQYLRLHAERTHC